MEGNIVWKAAVWSTGLIIEAEEKGGFIYEERLNTQDGFSHAFVEVVLGPHASWPHHASLRMLRILPK